MTPLQTHIGPGQTSRNQIETHTFQFWQRKETEVKIVSSHTIPWSVISKPASAACLPPSGEKGEGPQNTAQMAKKSTVTQVPWGTRGSTGLGSWNLCSKKETKERRDSLYYLKQEGTKQEDLVKDWYQLVLFYDWKARVLYSRLVCRELKYTHILITSKDLLYSTGDSPQYSVIN